MIKKYIFTENIKFFWRKIAIQTRPNFLALGFFFIKGKVMWESEIQESKLKESKSHFPVRVSLII